MKGCLKWGGFGCLGLLLLIVVGGYVTGIWSFIWGLVGPDGAPDNVVKAPHIFNARAVAFAPDGAVVVTSPSGDWNWMRLPDGKIEKTIAGAGGSGYSAFSADGKFLAVASSNTVRLYRVSDGKRLLDAAIHDPRLEQYSPNFIHVAASPDGKYVAASNSIESNLYVWRVSDQKLIAKLTEEPYRVFGWMADGVLSTGALFRIENDQLKEIGPFNKTFYNLQPWQVRPIGNGESFVFDDIGGVEILNLRNGARREIKFPDHSATDLKFSPDMKTFALRFQTGDSVRGPHIRSFVEVRRASDGALLQHMQVGTSNDGTDTFGTDLNISGDGKWLVIESRGGALHCWDMSGWTVPIPEPPSPNDEGKPRY